MRARLSYGLRQICTPGNQNPIHFNQRMWRTTEDILQHSERQAWVFRARCRYTSGLFELILDVLIGCWLASLGV